MVMNTIKTPLAATSTILVGIVFAAADLPRRETIHSMIKGKQKQKPAIERYSRCSTMMSGSGTTLDRGDNVIKNQRIEKASTGLILRQLIAAITSVIINSDDHNTGIWKTDA